MMNLEPDLQTRCGWCGSDPLYMAYHDQEWGVPSFDDRHLFEMLILEGAQAGLSWLTILRKRERYRQAFAGFDVAQVAGFTQADLARLLADPGIVRNRLKIASAIRNAQVVLRIREEHGESGQHQSRERFHQTSGEIDGAGRLRRLL